MKLRKFSAPEMDPDVQDVTVVQYESDVNLCVAQCIVTHMWRSQSPSSHKDLVNNLSTSSPYEPVLMLQNMCWYYNLKKTNGPCVNLAIAGTWP